MGPKQVKKRNSLISHCDLYCVDMVWIYIRERAENYSLQTVARRSSGGGNGKTTFRHWRWKNLLYQKKEKEKKRNLLNYESQKMSLASTDPFNNVSFAAFSLLF